MTSARERAIQWIEEDREMMLSFLADFTRAKSPNPPGDTLDAAKVVTDFLTMNALEYRTVTRDEKMPNIVASFDCSNPGKHVVLNGHMDVFPLGESEVWTKEPWGAEIEDGKMYGRGINDMKSGTASMIFTYMYLHRLREELGGKVTMTAVSDEETFGPNGAPYLVEQDPSVLGDVLLSTEPTGIHSVRFAEKGPLWLKFTIRTPGAHGAYAHKSKGSNIIAAQLIGDVVKLSELEVNSPNVVKWALEGVDDVVDKVASPGAAKILQKVTVNIGIVQGGVKNNMIPGQTIVHADIRVPMGLSPDAVIEEAAKIVAKYPEVEMEVTTRTEPLWSDPDHPMCKLLQDNAEKVGGFRPPAIVSLPGTDARVWRARGIPAYVYGVTPFNVAMADEYVDIEEVFHVLKTHTLAVIDYLTPES